MGKKKRQADHSVRADEDSSDSIEENQTKTTVSNCPHANKAIHLPGVKKALKTDGSALVCNGCCRGKSNVTVTPENENENEKEVYSLLMCLKCGHCGCGSGIKHAEQHSNNRKSDVHDLALDLTKWIVWCFKCDKEISHHSSKKLLECYEFVKKVTGSTNIELKAIPIGNEVEAKPSTSFMSVRSRKNSYSSVHPPGFEVVPTETISPIDSLPRVRGLLNLGNTCFFNAVLQCLGQTPFLLPILEEMKKEGEEFRLPGGEVQVGDVKENIEPLQGTLKGWGQITESLSDTLSELQSGKSVVYSPRKLLFQLFAKCPQLGGYAQHDSHELLRHLLELVRNEDLERYKQAILKTLNLDKKSERENITEELRRKVKAYGKQANDLLLRPEQVFSGFLVSTLECQECHHKSDHFESFLDLSLPVMPDKPIHVRPKSSYDEGGDLIPSVPSKHQLKMKRKAATKSRKSRHRNRQASFNAAGDTAAEEETIKSSSDSDNLDQSDADVEDNVEPEVNQNQDILESGYSSEKHFNGDSTCGSPTSETNVHNSDSAIASPITNNDSVLNKPRDQALDLTVLYNSLSDEETTSFPSQHSSISVPLKGAIGPVFQEDKDLLKAERTVSRFDYCGDTAENKSPNKMNLHIEKDNEKHHNNHFSNGEKPNVSNTETEKVKRLENGFGKLYLEHPEKEKEKSVSGYYGRSVEDDEDEDFNAGGTIGHRNSSDSGECTVHSCLNQFTVKELMTGNNKVGCEDCTKRVNQGESGKTVLTNTSKQLLISSPPAVLILHLKRFQVFGLDSKKKCREVKFPMVLDLAPYCSTKCKNGTTIKRNQTEILYSLYGVVEHMGTLNRGHYVAYVKVRAPLKLDDPRWSFLPKNINNDFAEVKESKDDVSFQNGAVGGTLIPPPGKWYYVSDSCTSEVKEENVLRSQAYLLFYERIW